jgi:hypothetical protein
MTLCFIRQALAANAMVPAVRSRGMRAKKPKFKKLTRNLKKKKAKQRNFQGNVIKVRLPALLHRDVKLRNCSCLRNSGFLFFA